METVDGMWIMENILKGFMIVKWKGREGEEARIIYIFF